MDCSDGAAALVDDAGDGDVGRESVIDRGVGDAVLHAISGDEENVVLGMFLPIAAVKENEEGRGGGSGGKEIIDFIWALAPLEICAIGKLLSGGLAARDVGFQKWSDGGDATAWRIFALEFFERPVSPRFAIGGWIGQFPSLCNGDISLRRILNGQNTKFGGLKEGLVVMSGGACGLRRVVGGLLVPRSEQAFEKIVPIDIGHGAAEERGDFIGGGALTG